MPVEPADAIAPAIDARRVFREAASCYVADRRARIGPFVDRHFSLQGSARLHRVALGLDLLRAPINLALAFPNLLRGAAAALLRRIGRPVPHWLDGGHISLRTNVDREIEWLVLTELLEMPYKQGVRSSRRDALSEAILSRPEVREMLAATKDDTVWPAAIPDLADRIADNLKRYIATRSAAAELTAALASLAAGWLVFRQLTPSALSLGPSVAEHIAHQSAVDSFFLGPQLGGLWYGFFPPAPSTDLIVGVTAGLLLAVAVAGAFAGVLADPFQRALGLHQRRLNKFLKVVEADLTGGRSKRFRACDDYVARLVDLVDGMGEAMKFMP